MIKLSEWCKSFFGYNNHTRGFCLWYNVFVCIWLMKMFISLGSEVAEWTSAVGTIWYQTQRILQWTVTVHVNVASDWTDRPVDTVGVLLSVSHLVKHLQWYLLTVNVKLLMSSTHLKLRTLPSFKLSQRNILLINVLRLIHLDLLPFIVVFNSYRFHIICLLPCLHLNHVHIDPSVTLLCLS